MKKKTPTARYVIALAGLLFVCFSYYAYQIFYTPNIQVDKKEDFYLYLPANATFNNVRDSLEKYNVLTDKLSFYFVAKLLGYQDQVKSGRYKLSKRGTNLQVIRKLRNGVQEPVKLTFNNIRLKKDLAEKLDAKLAFSADEFMILLHNKSIIEPLGFDTATVIGMFIPNTYQIYWDIKPEDFLARMYKEYTKFWTNERLSKAKAAGFTPSQITTLASIVEAETNKDSEKQRIAGVYINRLKTDMPLQADPTVKFAWQDFSIKRVTQEHTAIESPYNTYKNTGLPPGPINMPSTVSLDAVLNYEKHKFIYFCASPNEIGFHDFAENYRDHVNNANRYRKFLDKLDIH